MNLTSQYPILNKWKPEAGRKPSKKLLATVHESNAARPGSKDAVAIAMTLRPDGATQQQIAAVLGGPHRNKINHLVVSKKAKLVKMPERHGHMVYKLNLGQ